MKQILTILFLLTLGVNCFSQNIATLIWITDDNAEQFSFDVINVATSEVIMHGQDYANNDLYSMPINLPNGSIRFEMNDSECDGFTNGGSMMMVYNSSVLWHVIGDYGCDEVRITFFDYYDPCYNYCPTDFDQDGFTSVEDLIFFISKFGTTCE